MSLSKTQAERTGSNMVPARNGAEEKRSRFKDRQIPAAGSAGYSFCETIAASGSSPWHIRQLGAAGPKYSGGADSPTLCGRTMRLGGWDLDVVITEHHLEHVCRKCAEMFNKERAASGGVG